LLIRPHPLSPPFPYTTLFRSIRHPWATGNYGRRTTDDVLAFRQRSPLPRLRQQAFGEVEPLRQLAHLRLEPEHAIFQVRHTTLRDRKSTRLNSSHVSISYAVF